MGDLAVVDEALVDHTATVTGAEVAAHPVVVELVVVGARQKVAPPAAEGVLEKSSSPYEELLVIELLWTFTF